MSFTDTDYTASDAVALAAAIRAGQLSPAEAVAHAFAAIDRVNPQLNAVILTMREAAEEQLRRLPANAPLRGVPVLLKDDCPTYAGVPMSFGCRAARGYVPAHDHEIVRRYQAAGMVIVGKTNLPEFSGNIATSPTLHGPTLNPWDARRSIGGSSGGAAAAVASGMVPVAYGNDGAGSIRIPASCGGLFGLRASRGRTPCGPVSSENWGGLVSHHALTRSVRDSALLLDLTDAPEAGALYAAPAKSGPYAEAATRDPRPLRIGVVTQPGLGLRLDDEVAAALEDAAALCRTLGHAVHASAFPLDASAFADAYVRIIAAYTALEVDAIAADTGRPADADGFEPVNLGLAEFGRSLSAPQLLAARNTVNSVARSLGAVFADVDILLTPVLPTLPPPMSALNVRGPDWRAFADEFMHGTVYTRPANAAGIPAMSVPLFQTTAGLPIGIQFMAPYGDETTLFELAGQLERARPWRHRVPPLHA
ncbi:amidase [Achromobacter sp. NPDC008082]|uniref:amidase n=1 Tax=Achromobacter sp. NPDC008082 TaxID=3363888 RepID=UPI0036F00343